MLYIVVGPNGSGKSRFGLHLIAKELCEGTRPVVTTLAVSLPDLCEVMAEVYGEKAPDLLGRLVVIDKEQLRQFWRYRGVSKELCKVFWELVGGVPRSRGEFAPIEVGQFGGPDWITPEGWPGPKIGNGTYYVLDEIHTAFGSRDWTKTGAEFVTYQSQHRKLGDDVVAITPQSSLVEKQFRVLCGRCIVLTNLYQLAKWGLRAPKKLEYRTYINCPPAPGEDYLEKGYIEIDPERWGRCYRTEAGLGVVGTGRADKDRQAKGLPWWTIFPAGLVIAVFAWFVAKTIVGGSVAWGIKQTEVSPIVAAVQSNNVVPGVSASPTLVAPVSQLPEAMRVGSEPARTNRLLWRGFAKFGGVYHVMLNDGRTVTRPWLEVRDDRMMLLGEGWLEKDTDIRPGGYVPAESSPVESGPVSPMRIVRVVDGKTGRVLNE